MNKDKQRITIAEACGKGWRLADDGWWDGPNGNEGVNYERMLDRLPDYLNDLNFMHEAEKVLFSRRTNGTGAMDSDPAWKYVAQLSDLCGPDHLFHATASQRAEAFLRTIGKWEEDE